MTLYNKADGRGYLLIPVSNNDPKPAVLNGKLYGKIDAGEVQLFFETDLGTVYQVTPPGGGVTPNPLILPELPGDPGAGELATGFVYTKDEGGTTQLYFEDPAFNVIKLSHPFIPSVPVFIYDDLAVPSENIYNTMAALLSQAATIVGPKVIQIRPTSHQVPAGSYDMQDCALVIGGKAADGEDWTSLTFEAGSILVNPPYLLQNIQLVYDASSAGGANNDFCTLTDQNTIILEGTSGLQGLAPAAGAGSMFNLDAGDLTLMVRDSSSVNNSPNSAAWRMFTSGGSRQLTIDMYVGGNASGINGNAEMFGGDLNVTVFGIGPSVPLSTFTKTTGDVFYKRTWNGSLNDVRNEIVSPPAFAAQQNNYEFAGLHTSNVIRFASTGPQSISGFNTTVEDQDNQNPQVRTCINVGASTITLLHDNAGSAVGSRILCSTGVNLLILANQWFFLWYDSASAHWRAKL
jgi:hypothetical protein